MEQLTWESWVKWGAGCSFAAGADADAVVVVAAAVAELMLVVHIACHHPHRAHPSIRRTGPRAECAVVRELSGV